jgi:hypothetical protein
LKDIFVKLEKPGGFTAKRRGVARLTGIDQGRIGSDPSDLDPTVGLARTCASGGGRAGRGGELVGATPSRAGVHDLERGKHRGEAGVAVHSIEAPGRAHRRRRRRAMRRGRSGANSGGRARAMRGTSLSSKSTMGLLTCLRCSRGSPW